MLCELDFFAFYPVLIEVNSSSTSWFSSSNGNQYPLVTTPAPQARSDELADYMAALEVDG